MPSHLPNRNRQTSFRIPRPMFPFRPKPPLHPAFPFRPSRPRQKVRSSPDNSWAWYSWVWYPEGPRCSFRSIRQPASSGSTHRGSTAPGPSPRCASRPCCQSESLEKSTTKAPSRLQPKSLSRSSPLARRIRVAIGTNGSSHDLQFTRRRRKGDRQRLAGTLIEQGDLGVASKSLCTHR